MTLDPQTIARLRQLSKDDAAFEELIALVETQDSKYPPRFFNLERKQDVADYHAYLLEIVEDAIISLDANWKVVSWNRAAEKMYGWREDEIIGRRLSELIPTEYPGGTIAESITRLQEVGLFEDDFIHQRRDGSKIFIHTMTSVIRGDDGQITGYVAINRDITARKEAERRLADSEQFLRAVLEGTQTGIFVLHVSSTGDFYFVSLNPAHERATGYRTEDIQGKRPEELPGISPEDAAALRANYQRCVEAGQTVTYEENVELGGKRTWWLTQLTPLMTIERRIHTIVGTTLNITELRQTQEALLESEQFLRTIYESDQVQFLVVDVHENGDFVYAGYSPGLARATHIPADRVIGRRLQDVDAFSPGLISSLQGHYRRCVEGGVPITFETGGQRGWWLTQLSPMKDATGRIYRLIGINIEITERKNIEKASEELVRLELELEKEREMRAFQTRIMTMITHDFKTPLATIQTSTDLLKNHADRFSGEAILKRLERIQAQVSIIDSLVDATIAMRRSEIYEYTPQPEVIELEPFLETIVQDVCGYRESDCFVSLTPKGGPSGLFDATLLRQIAMNLILNAVKYSPTGKQVCVRYDCQLEGMELVVQDSGIGIPEEEQEHIFKLFYRAGNAVNLEGNGMGLAIVKQAVDWHSGTIEITSQIGKGTQFTVYLPQLR